MIKSFPANLERLYEMLQFVLDHSKIVGFDVHNLSNIELATEEALVNIISYGYPEKPGDIEIICIYPEKKGIQIIIKDRGVPYNPLKNIPKKNNSLPIEERSLGGYGIYFILKIMDEVDYKRDSGQNVLTLTKYIL